MAPEYEDDATGRTPACYAVAVYLCDRAYGGPEEGGWYYDTGEISLEPLHFLYLRGFATRDAATAHCAELNMLMGPFWNEGRPDIGSVLSQCQYFATVTEGMPASWPDKRPHYE